MAWSGEQKEWDCMAGRLFAIAVMLLTPALADAAAFTSKADGNWSASGQTTWNEVGVPGNGDTVTIGAGHDITVDVNTTIGDSPGTAANVITVNTTGTITVATGVTFTIKGCVQMEDGNFTMNAGSTVEFQVPSGLRYWFRTGKAHSDTCRIIINGSSGSRCAFRSSSGAGIAYIDSQNFFTNSLIQGEYCDFTRIGDATEDFVEPYMNGSGQDFYLRNCTITSCGNIDTHDINTNSSFELTNCIWTTTVGAKPLELSSSNALAGGETRSITGCSFDKQPEFFSCIGLSVTNTYFAEGISSTAGTGYVLFEDNFVRKTTQSAVTIYGTATDCYWFKESVDNPHFLGLADSLSTNVTGTVFEYAGTHTNGDCILVNAGTVAVSRTISGCIVLPNGAGDTSGTLFSALGDADVTFTANHNTYFNNVSGTGPAIAETYTGHSGMLASFRSNLSWSDAANEAHIIQDSGTNDAVSGYITNFGYNGIWNPRSPSYDLAAGTFTNDYTANDVTGDPDFVDETRDLASWDASLGGAGTASAALARIAADPMLIDDCVTWVKAGFVVRNSAFNGTAHDGGVIGAMGYTPASVVSPLSASIPGSGLDPLYRGPVQ